ncbi:MAG: hypothetical protein H6617_01985 [Bdellovibrionaceae bacterium]|nr:hypothetical protein [Pseudobdellovibrionaceae bacterium]
MAARRASPHCRIDAQAKLESLRAGDRTARKQVGRSCVLKLLEKTPLSASKSKRNIASNARWFIGQKSEMRRHWAQAQRFHNAHPGEGCG